MKKLPKEKFPKFIMEKLEQRKAIKDTIDEILERLFNILIQKHIAKELPHQIRGYFQNQVQEIAFLDSINKKSNLFKNKSPRLRLAIPACPRPKRDNWVRKEVPEHPNEKLIGHSRIEKALKGAFNQTKLT